MGVSAPVAAKASGLTNVVDTIAAPAEAFERMRTAPTWGWALILTLVLSVVGAYLQGPAARHAAVVQMQHMVQTSTFFANMTAEQKQQALQRAGQPSVWSYIGPVIGIFFAAFFNTLFMLIGNAVGRGSADFKRLWAGSMNIAFPTIGIGALVLGVIAMLRGPDAFNSSLDLVRAMPGLGFIAPQGNPGLTAFLSTISVFSLWGLFLNATMLRVTAKTPAGVAYTFAAIVLLLGALFAYAGVAMAHSFGAV